MNNREPRTNPASSPLAINFHAPPHATRATRADVRGSDIRANSTRGAALKETGTHDAGWLVDATKPLDSRGKRIKGWGVIASDRIYSDTGA